MRYALAIVALAMLACGRSDAATVDAASARQAATPAQQGGGVAGFDTLQFVAHPGHVQAGFPSHARPLALTNPYEGKPDAVKVGAQLFVSYNCVDCHGADGSGAMGPSLADGRWHFGGGPAEVFESIYEGRPEGMPSWGGRIADDQVWMLVAYVRSLSAGKDVSSENFTGKTVERTGH